MTALLPVDEALQRLLDLAAPVPAEAVPLAQAAGRWTAADIIAARTQPFHDLSAMDGYAIRFSDLPGPWRVVGESAAGGPVPAPAASRQAVRIFTGAPLPPSADTILIQEEASRDGNRLTMTGSGPSREGAHVRRRGSDFQEADTIIGQGVRLSPAHIALAAMGGNGTLPVARQVRISVLATGDELVPPGGPIEPGKLPSSNTPMLAALLGSPAAIVTDLGIAPDRIDAIEAAILQATDADIIITTGGASVGDHDLVKPALEAIGAKLDFWKVAMRPGKPLMAGTLGRTIILGLPGNPVSAYVTALLFARPLVAALAGAADPLPPVQHAPLGRPMPASGPRTHFIRARWDNGRAIPLGDQDSANLGALSNAGILIRRDAGAPAAGEGELVPVLNLA